MKKIKQKQKGYTLIEIIVVISIIGLVMTSALYAFNVARIKSRDAKRLVDIKTIEKAIKLYYDDNDIYPGDDDWYYNDACDASAYSGPISTLISPNYLSSVPDDPNNNIEIDIGCYWYQRRNSGQGYVILMPPENSDLFDEDMDCSGGGGYYSICEND